MKKVFFTFILLLLGVNLYAQRQLSVKDNSSATDIFSGEENEAGIVVSCPANIQLSFESSVDKIVNVYKTEAKGEENLYYIKFNVGRRYDGRRLTIIASGYTSRTIPIELTSKQLKRFQIVDEDMEFAQGTYYEFRKRGLEFYEKLMYSEAKENFTIAKMSSDCPADSNIDELINSVDSISYYNKQAQQASELLDYATAVKCYTRILELNPMDTNAATMRSQAENSSFSDCTRYFNQAELYYDDGEYEKAEELYQKVVDLNCNNITAALERLKTVKSRLSLKKQKAHVFTIEFPLTSKFKAMGTDYNFEKNSGFSIGFSTGTYKSRKAGAYFSLNLNPGLIESLQKEVEGKSRSIYDKNLEANIAIGWTVNPVKSQNYVWLFFTPFGYTATCFFTEGTESDPDSSLHTRNWCHAISPEAGFLVKLGPIALRYTFQYRYAFGTGLSVAAINGDSSLGVDARHIRHQLGIGFCW